MWHVTILYIIIIIINCEGTHTTPELKVRRLETVAFMGAI